MKMIIKTFAFRSHGALKKSTLKMIKENEINITIFPIEGGHLFSLNNLLERYYEPVNETAFNTYAITGNENQLNRLATKYELSGKTAWWIAEVEEDEYARIQREETKRIQDIIAAKYAEDDEEDEDDGK